MFHRVPQCSTVSWIEIGMQNCRLKMKQVAKTRGNQEIGSVLEYDFTSRWVAKFSWIWGKSEDDFGEYFAKFGIK